MRKSIFKRAAVSLSLVAALTIVPALTGCQGSDGGDGINGKDLNIYDIWQETKVQTGNPDLTYDEFLREYLSFSSEDLQQTTSLRATINRSLMSGVSIITTFDEYVRGSARSASYYGSGVILDIDRQSGDMIVVTNCHVVYSVDARISLSGALNADNGFAKSVNLWLYGSEFIESNAIEAQIIGASKNYDIAVLKVSGNDLVKNSQAVAAQWCGGEESFVGETVYAVGNADGKKLSSSVGYISKDSEEVSVNMGSSTKSEVYTYRVLRTDTAINGGNSGGGLFNKYGELVGIVNAKTVSEKIDNMGYALPASTCKRVVERLIADADGNYGLEVASAGFNYEATDSYTTGLNASGIAEIKDVVTVTKVSVFSEAYKKLEVGDVIKSVAISRNGKIIQEIEIERLHNLTDAFLSVKAGDGVTFRVERNGEEKQTPSITYDTSDFVRKV